MSVSHPLPRSLTRRRFLQYAAAGAGSLAFPNFSKAAEVPAADGVSFFLVGDTHYYASKDSPKQLDEDSQVATSRLVDWLNNLPGTDISPEAGGGKVATPKGVIHAGDLIDSGDKGNAPVARQMQETETAAFLADWGLNGGDAKLKWPCYEVHGNHDGPRGETPIINEIVSRNKRRKNLAAVSDNGMHYAWNWGGVHFLNLGIVVGGTKEVARERRYDPRGSLAFLEDYLAKQVGDSGAPVVLTHHVDVPRYSGPCGEEAPKGNPEWDPCDTHAYYKALAKYNVIALLWGHTHARKISRWDGTPKEPATGGLAIFNTDNAAHYKSTTQAILHFEIGKQEMVVREFGTKDVWSTGAWTPQVWRFPVKRV